MEIRVLLYAYNVEESIKDVIDHIRKQGLVPVVVDDGSEDNTLEILKTYYDTIDIVHFDVHRGFYTTMLSGFRHIVRGSDAQAVIVFRVDEDNPLYIRQILEMYKQEQKDLYILNRLDNKSSWLTRIVQYIFSLFSKILYGFQSKDPLNTYALLSRRLITTIVEQVSLSKQILLTHMYIYAAQDNNFSYEWITVDAIREDSLEQTLKSFRTLIQ